MVIDLSENDFCDSPRREFGSVYLPLQNYYTTKIAAVQNFLITICADALAAEWRLL